MYENGGFVAIAPRSERSCSFASAFIAAASSSSLFIGTAISVGGDERTRGGARC